MGLVSKKDPVLALDILQEEITEITQNTDKIKEAG
jgi:hypothetical protein